MAKICFTDLPDSRIFSEQIPDRGKNDLKAKFIEVDRARAFAYAKDLEEALMINKSLLEKVIEGSNLNVVYKSLLLSLNKENVGLLKMVQKTVKERDDLQCRLLIAEQILESLMSKDTGNGKRIASKKAEKLLREYGTEKIKIVESKHRAKSNVPSQYTQPYQINEVGERDYSYNELRYENEKPISFKNKPIKQKTKKTPLIPRLDLSRLRTSPSNLGKESNCTEARIKELNKKAQELEAQNKFLSEKVKEFEKKNRSLTVLNITWSESVRKMELKLQSCASRKPNLSKPLVLTPHRESSFDGAEEDADIQFPTMLKLSSCNTYKTKLGSELQTQES
eukprot:TRINITY_DN5053_c0_g1_i15.p1 TRINITY_DN5053_c0_g1~~TRINITY_DN5053_c0_g1_i15.p1  ORF type:complete len:347 (-),score=74.71 TRINITY_DN5053_c0_g1_i15:84-1094(-)